MIFRLADAGLIFAAATCPLSGLVGSAAYKIRVAFAGSVLSLAGITHTDLPCRTGYKVRRTFTSGNIRLVIRAIIFGGLNGIAVVENISLVFALRGRIQRIIITAPAKTGIFHTIAKTDKANADSLIRIFQIGKKRRRRRQGCG